MFVIKKLRKLCMTSSKFGLWIVSVYPGCIDCLLDQDQ